MSQTTYIKVSYYYLNLPFTLISEYFSNTFGIDVTKEQMVCFSIHTMNTDKTCRYVNRNKIFRTLPKEEVEVPKEVSDKLEELYIKNPTIKDKAALLTLILITRSNTMPHSEPLPKAYQTIDSVILS
jgi:hypothetical protein